MLLGGMGWDEWERRGEAGHSLSVEVCLPDAMWGAMVGLDWTAIKASLSPKVPCPWFHAVKDSHFPECFGSP